MQAGCKYNLQYLNELELPHTISFVVDKTKGNVLSNRVHNF